MQSLRTIIQIHKGIKQHATVFSVLVVVMLFGLFLEAYMHDFNLVYITLFFVFSLAFSAGSMGVFNLGYLEADFSPSQRLFASKEGHISMKIHNKSNTPSWDIHLFGEDASVVLPKLKGEGSSTLHIPFTPLRRGSFSHGNFYMQSKYPLSTVRFTKSIDKRYEGLVFPEPKGRSLSSFLNEEEKHYGEEKDFDGLSDYDGSQRLSHIHWVSVAKGEMAVKVFTKETQTPKLVFHFQALEGSDEKRLSQLCLWVLECEKQHLPFSIQLPRQSLSYPKESIDDILEQLARY